MMSRADNWISPTLGASTPCGSQSGSQISGMGGGRGFFPRLDNTCCGENSGANPACQPPQNPGFESPAIFAINGSLSAAVANTRSLLRGNGRTVRANDDPRNRISARTDGNSGAATAGGGNSTGSGFSGDGRSDDSPGGNQGPGATPGADSSSGGSYGGGGGSGGGSDGSALQKATLGSSGQGGGEEASAGKGSGLQDGGGFSRGAGGSSAAGAPASSGGSSSFFSKFFGGGAGDSGQGAGGDAQSFDLVFGDKSTGKPIAEGMLSKDPDNYFDRLSKHHNIFEVMSLRYQRVSQHFPRP